jgi:hypothetical protein
MQLSADIPMGSVLFSAVHMLLSADIPTGAVLFSAVHMQLSADIPTGAVLFSAAQMQLSANAPYVDLRCLHGALWRHFLPVCFSVQFTYTIHTYFVMYPQKLRV